MGDPVRFQVTVFGEAATEAAITEFCKDHLEAKGYEILKRSEKWETPKQFAKRVGFHGHRLREYIERYEARSGITVRTERSTGALRRITAIQSTPGFEAFIRDLKRNRK